MDIQLADWQHVTLSSPIPFATAQEAVANKSDHKSATNNAQLRTIQTARRVKTSPATATIFFRCRRAAEREDTILAETAYSAQTSPDSFDDDLLHGL